MQFAKGRRDFDDARAPEIELLTETISMLDVVEFYW
jgi:hypothetical protein